MITSVSGAAWGSCFLLQKDFCLSSTSVVLAAISCGLNLTTIVRIGFVINFSSLMLSSVLRLDFWHSQRPNFFTIISHSNLKKFWERKQDAQATPDTLVIISWKLEKLWKNRFFGWKNCILEFQLLCDEWQKSTFFHQKMTFFQKVLEWS